MLFLLSSRTYCTLGTTFIHTYIHPYIRTHVHICMYVCISIFQHSFADICDSGYLHSSSVKAALDDLEKVLALNSTHILALQSK